MADDDVQQPLVMPLRRWTTTVPPILNNPNQGSNQILNGAAAATQVVTEADLVDQEAAATQVVTEADLVDQEAAATQVVTEVDYFVPYPGATATPHPLLITFGPARSNLPISAWQTTDNITPQWKIFHYADAVIFATLARVHQVDAVISKTSSVSHQVDAVLRSETTVDHLADAVIVKTSVVFHGVDAVILKTSTVSHSVDAIITTASTEQSLTQEVLEVDVSGTKQSLTQLVLEVDVDVLWGVTWGWVNQKDDSG